MRCEETPHILNLTFKGGRNYLHGTDIIPALLEIAGEVRSLTVQINRMTSHVLVAREITAAQLAELRKKGKLCVLMSYERAAGGAAMIAVTEDLSRKVTASRPYDEAAVVRTATRDGNRIRQGASPTGSFFERVVALNKRLLNELEGKTDWLFCGLELTRVPAQSAPLSVTMTSNFARSMYRSTVEADGMEVGALIFARRSER